MELTLTLNFNDGFGFRLLLLDYHNEIIEM